MARSVFVVVSLLLVGILAQFEPTLEVTSCTKGKLELTLINGENDGIIYIQGQSAACRQVTTSGISLHTVDFGSCGIQWEENFKVIVQKKALYQTGDDKQIPVMCIADLGDLSVSNNLDIGDKDDDAGINKTVKPTATMSLFRNGENINGGTVKLTDVITMVMQLDAEYIEDFDIKATSCFADTIEIIQDACPIDVELFPTMSKLSQGIVNAEFGAFRTTSLAGGSVGMPFSCTLQVCLGSCTPTTCSDGTVSYGRKKRSLVKRQAEDNAVEDISVGGMVSVTSEELTVESSDDEGKICMTSLTFAVLVWLLAAGVIFTTTLRVFLYRRQRKKSDAISKQVERWSDAIARRKDLLDTPFLIRT